MLIKSLRNCSSSVLSKAKRVNVLLHQEVKLQLIEIHSSKSLLLPPRKYFSTSTNKYDTLLSYARGHREKGDLDDALVSYQEAEKSLSADSEKPTPTKMQLKVEVASLYEQRGDIQTCLDLLFVALDISRTLYGERDMETGKIFARIASSYDQAGLMLDSLQAKLTALDIFSQLESKMEPEYLGKFYISLAKSYADNQRLDQSIQTSLKGIALLEPSGNSDLIATAYSNMSLCALSLRKYDQALQYAQKAVDILSTSHGKDSSMLYSALANLGQCYDKLNKYSEALATKERSLEIAKKHAGQESTLTANAYNNLGYTYYLMKDYEKALEYYNKARETIESVLGESHPATLDVYLGIGSLLIEIKDYKKALETWNTYLRGVEEGQGDKKNTEYYRGLTQRARAYQGLGNLNAAKSDLKSAVEIAAGIHGEDGLELNYLYLHLARALISLKEFDLALDNLAKATKICEMHLREKSLELGLILEATAECKAQTGRGNEAIQHAKQSLDILQLHLPKTHPAVLANQRLIQALER